MVSWEKEPLWFNMRDTAAFEIPAASAMSWIVAIVLLRLVNCFTYVMIIAGNGGIATDTMASSQWISATRPPTRRPTITANSVPGQRIPFTWNHF